MYEANCIYRAEFCVQRFCETVWKNVKKYVKITFLYNMGIAFSDDM